MSTATTTTARRRTRKSTVPAFPIRKAVGPQPELLASKSAARPLREDYTYLADKAPTTLHTEMAAWMTEQTGVKITAKQAQIVAVLRLEFQRSPENQAMLAARRAESAQRKAKSVKVQPKAAAKKTAKRATKVAGK